MEERIAIVGWAMTPFSRCHRNYHRGELVNSAMMSLVKSTNVPIERIDYFCDASDDVLDGISISNCLMIEAMGAFMKEETKIEEDGAFAAMHALQRLRLGYYKTAVVVAHGKVSDSSPEAYSNLINEPFYQRPLGLESLTAHALQADRFLQKKRATVEDAAHWAVRCHQNGLNNPQAHGAKDLTFDQVMKSKNLASPIRRWDASPITDGAACILMAVESEAKKITRNPVWIDGVGFSHDLHYIGHREDLADPRSAREAARMAYAMAGVKDPRREIDLAEIYGHFTYQDLMLMEALGLCEEGQAGQFSKSAFPVNPSGGALCANPVMVTGLVRLIEAAMQLTGAAGKHQVKKPVKRAVAHAVSGLCLQSNLVTVLSTGA